MAFPIVLIGFLCLNAVLTQQYYTSQFDNTDVDAILKNDRLIKQYVDCLVDKKPCTKQGEMLKDHIVDALNTNCDKCTDMQKKIIKKIIRHMVDNHPDWWKLLCDKFDPDGEYRKKFDVMYREALEMPL